jgi:proline-specific peptidase
MEVTQEGRVPVPGGEVAYRIVGEGERTLLTLHGGPGATSWYLYSLADLAGDGVRVVFWDQLGCGDSDAPDDPSLWRVERFVDEVEAVRSALDLGRVDVLGQSWGGMLAQEYALAHPEAVRTLILASTICSSPFHRSELRRLAEALPEPAREPLLQAMSSGDTSGEGYAAAVEEAYRRHVCRIPYPPDVKRAFDAMAMPVYGTMWGPDEFLFVGNLADWDVCERIGAIQAPTLITVGRHDELTPASSEMIQERIAGSELVVFEDSAHLAHWEERERYMAVVRDFLGRHPA